ncbi:MAG: tRNA epoxyqueuosine(34) reductase QueG [Anaerolineales bacterium]|nr:tRNA epoxyqueuosine(34) reductase QueG [Anaerolineales bacterium]
MNGKDLKELARVEAERLGFGLFGVTRPEPSRHAAVFNAWLAAGRHGEMAYLASERSRLGRSDPGALLPGCRSIVVLGMAYPAFEHGEQPGAGKVAAYAWGADYHELLAERLRSLVRFIEAQVGEPVANRWYTDTGPLLERELAQRAGLGWIGKNSCLIHPGGGSNYLLSEILLGVELDADAPFEADHCGSCTRCLEACPTGCILPNRTIDARRCISYLTIELKGAIPVELRPQLAGWVFGCDVCQQVCPWNRFADRQAIDFHLMERPGVARPELIEELRLSREDFNRKFKGSPVQRAKRRGYLRNTAVVLGQLTSTTGDPGATAALVEVLQHDPEALVRGHAAWALGQIGGEAARRALLQAVDGEAEPAVREEIHLALEHV